MHAHRETEPVRDSQTETETETETERALLAILGCLSRTHRHGLLLLSQQLVLLLLLLPRLERVPERDPAHLEALVFGRLRSLCIEGGYFRRHAQAVEGYRAH